MAALTHFLYSVDTGVFSIAGLVGSFHSEESCAHTLWANTEPKAYYRLGIRIYSRSSLQAGVSAVISKYIEGRTCGVPSARNNSDTRTDRVSGSKPQPTNSG